MAARRSAAGTGSRNGTLSVTWVRSTIGHTQATRGTIRALGLRRLNQTIELADTPANRGMLRRVAFLLDVRESKPKEAAPARSERASDETGATKDESGASNEQTRAATEESRADQEGAE